VRGCTQKFPDWPPGVRTANDTALCHYVQLYCYFVSQSSEFCCHNPLCCFSTSVYFCLFRYRASPEIFGYTFIYIYIYIYIHTRRNDLCIEPLQPLLSCKTVALSLALLGTYQVMHSNAFFFQIFPLRNCNWAHL
jgi:hypothetical protein